MYLHLYHIFFSISTYQVVAPELSTFFKTDYGFSNTPALHVSSIQEAQLTTLRPEVNTLLDTDDTQWANWSTNTGKYEGWRLQTHPLLQHKVFGVCQVLRQTNDNWVYSPLVDVQEAHAVVIKVTFTIRSCAAHPESRAVKNCHESLQLLTYQTNLSLADTGALNESRHFYKKIDDLVLDSLNSAINTTASSGLNQSSSIKFTEEIVKTHHTQLRITSSYLIVAIRDTGACATLRHVLVQYFACPSFQNGLLIFPRTPALDEISTIRVKGRCVSGSFHPMGTRLPFVGCKPDGHWCMSTQCSIADELHSSGILDNGIEAVGECVCMPGYGLVTDRITTQSTCQVCSKNEYKIHAGSTPCLRCPKNSYRHSIPEHFKTRQVESTQTRRGQASIVDHVPGDLQSTLACYCHPGYYRHPKTDTEESACSTIPSQPLNLQVNTSDPARVELWWKPPKYTGDRKVLWFELHCTEDSGQVCTRHPTYVPPVRTHSTRAAFIGLALGRTYKLSVVAINDLSELFTSSHLLNSTASMIVRLPEAVDAYVYNVTMSAINTEEFEPSPTALMQSSISRFPPNHRTSGRFVRIDWDTMGTQAEWIHPRNQTLSLSHPVLEYQVYVWMKPASESSVTDEENRLILVHFLSDTWVYLTEFPPKAIFTVWVRPRTTYGWGKYTKATFDFPSSVHEWIYPMKLTRDDYVNPTDEPLSPANLAEKLLFTKWKYNIVWLLIASSLAACILLVLYGFITLYRKLHRDSPPETSTYQEEVIKVINASKAGEQKLSSSPKTVAKVLADLQKDDDETSEISNEAENIQATENCLTTAEPSNGSLSKITHHFKSELNPARLKILNTIGEGEFGEVCAGELDGLQVVAVKTLRTNVPQKAHHDFLTEAATMEKLSHSNVITLIGVITRSEPMAIVTEFMKHGSLDKYLRNTNMGVTRKQLLHILLDICEGMKYIADLRYIHRDLAARNVLMNEHFTCKISDFGLARKVGDNFTEENYDFTGGKVPIRWTAPEAVLYRRFSPASDVWSYGIVIWEVFTYGQRPYWEWTNQTVINMLERGYRLPAPEHCPLGVRCLMLDCWLADPAQRPKFDNISLELSALILREPDIIQKSGLESIRSRPDYSMTAKEPITSSSVSLNGDVFLKTRNINRSNSSAGKFQNNCKLQETISEFYGHPAYRTLKLIPKSPNAAYQNISDAQVLTEQCAPLFC